MQSVTLVNWFAAFADKVILPAGQENICAAHRRHLPRGPEIPGGRSSRRSSHAIRGTWPLLWRPLSWL